MIFLKEIYHLFPAEFWMGLMSMAVMGTWIALVLIAVFFFDGGGKE